MKPDIETGLEQVRQRIRLIADRTAMQVLTGRFESVITGGKMLRARLLLQIGTTAGTDLQVLCRAAACVELLHAASLLHDDILDNGTIRRGRPSLWVEEGVRAGIITGDFLLSLAMEEMQENLPDRMTWTVQTLREMCEAEAEQEFAERSENHSWEQVVSIARRKTGGLFGLAAVCSCGADEHRDRNLYQAGCALGTAYQLADDLLDAEGLEIDSGKTLGTDASSGKPTAVSVCPPEGTVREAVSRLSDESEKRLIRWPVIQQAWRGYLHTVFVPALESFRLQPAFCSSGPER